MYQNSQQVPYSSGYYSMPQNPYMRGGMTTTPTYTAPQIVLKGRPVSSIDEVKASAIDFDGSVFYFPDIANRRIYTKQIGMDGSPLYNVYELTPIQQEPNNNFVTREEFEKAINYLRQNSTVAPAQTSIPVSVMPEPTATVEQR